MNEAKQEAIRLIESMPEQVSMEDIQYQLYFRAAVEAGMAAADRGEAVPHDEAMLRIREWLDAQTALQTETSGDEAR